MSYYHVYKLVEGDFMEYLPKDIKAKRSRIQNNDRICKDCKSFRSLEYSHACFAGWTDIIPSIQQYTRDAIVKYSSVSKIDIPLYNSREVSSI